MPVGKMLVLKSSGPLTRNLPKELQANRSPLRGIQMDCVRIAVLKMNQNPMSKFKKRPHASQVHHWN